MKMPLDNIASNFPPGAMIGLRDRYGLVQAAETGTCCGRTALLLGLAFPKVTTVEACPRVYQWCKDFLRPMYTVGVVNAYSERWLAETDWAKEPPTLFYLDAHHGHDDWKPEVAIPLLDELRAIGGLYGKHAIVIDDFADYKFVAPVVDGWGPLARFSKPRDEPHGYEFQALTLDECPWKDWLP